MYAHSCLDAFPLTPLVSPLSLRSPHINGTLICLSAMSRAEALSAPSSLLSSPPGTPAAGRGEDAATNKADGGTSSLLADLDDFMGGLSLPGFASGVVTATAASETRGTDTVFALARVGKG